jgi:transaldolase
MEPLQQNIHDFVVNGLTNGPENMNRGEILPDSTWQHIRRIGTRLWLDTGDIGAARELWDPDFEALTTNNTLLNKEIQKGHYDELISEAAAFLSNQDQECSPADLLLEINFILNARHGLRLARIFNAHVSVELHTDLANDVERSVEYGRRFYAICPEQFYIKVPFTPAGLIAARRLGEENIPVNLTLGFSVRQNIFAAQFARPAFVNVFLGRLNAFVEQSGLGTGENTGEKTTRAVQRAICALRKNDRTESRLIAASMRNGDQVSTLAGVDVMTLPLAVVKEFEENPDPQPENRIEQDLSIPMQPGFTTADFNGDSLWEVSGPVHTAILELMARAADTRSPEELTDHFARAGCSDFLPAWTVDEIDTVMRGGKIPDFSVWGSRLKSHELGLDALMNISALCAFVTDQQALDERIRSLI